jgi:hypothetical protein
MFLGQLICEKISCQTLFKFKWFKGVELWGKQIRQIKAETTCILRGSKQSLRMRFGEEKMSWEKNFETYQDEIGDTVLENVKRQIQKSGRKAGGEEFKRNSKKIKIKVYLSQGKEINVGR